MGYRSEVKIATTREGYDKMCERVDALSEGLGTLPSWALAASRISSRRATDAWSSAGTTLSGTRAFSPT